MTNEEQPTTAPVPSPEMFARPADPADDTAPGSVDEASTDHGSDTLRDGEGTRESAPSEPLRSRFPKTGDSRVDEVIAHLPDPDAHRDRSRDGSGNTASSDGDHGPSSGETLPDPALLDDHITDVTSVHRQLQQRLSDLSS